ncbi:hypothetical protein [Colwellia demingiae]
MMLTEFRYVQCRPLNSYVHGSITANSFFNESYPLEIIPT